MNIEEVKKIAQETMTKSIMENLDSAIIFKYISNLEVELDKKEAVINEMAEEIASYNRYEAGALDEKEEVIKFYTNKVEREGK